MTKARVWLLLILSWLAVLSSIRESQPARAAGALTLPIVGFGLTSWFDHTSPASSGAGLSDNCTTMTRYDGGTGYSYNGHAGLDYGTGQQTGYNVLASTDGTVQFVGWQSADPNAGFGFYVRLWHATLPYSTLYGHMDGTQLVSNGQYVPRGTVIGYSASTGQSTGPHLHFGVYNSQSGWTPIDPYGWSGTSNACSGGSNDPWGYDIGYLWSTNPPSMQPPVLAGADACSWSSSRLDVLARGTNSGLWQKYWTPTGWSGWVSMGATTDSDPTCVSITVNRIDVFYRLGQGLWQKYWSGSWSNPISLGGNITSGPDACSWDANRIDVFARGPNNDLQQNYWTPSGWSNWVSQGGTLASDPTCVSMQTNRIDVFYRGADGSIYQLYWAGSWTGPISLVGNFTSAPDACSWGANRIDVFARGPNNDLQQKYWTPSGWSGWLSLGGSVGSDPTCESMQANRLDVFYSGTDGALWQSTWSGSWSGPISLGTWPLENRPRTRAATVAKRRQAGG